MFSTSTSSPEADRAPEWPAKSSSRRRIALWWAGIILVWTAGLSLLLIVAKRGETPADISQILTEARTALRQQEFDRVADILAPIGPEHSQWPAARLLAGEAAWRQGDSPSALAAYGDAAAADPETSAVARLAMGEIYRHEGRLEQAERAYRDVLAAAPEDPAVHKRLAYVLGVSGRRWESREHLLRLIESRSWSLDDLVLLGDLERRMGQRDYLLQAAQAAPEDLFVLQALAHVRLVEGRNDECRDLLQQVIARDAQQIAAQALLGELLVDADPAAFADWHAALPAAADEHPEIWYVRGLWARSRNDLKPAARCFWECVRRIGFHRRANYALGQTLAALGEPEHEEFSRRAADLSQLGFDLESVLESGGRDEAAMRRVSQSMEQMGRLWEACAWGTTAQRQFPAAGWPGPIIARTAPLLKSGLPQMLDEANLAARHDLSSYPDHRRLLGSSAVPPRLEAARDGARRPVSGSARIRFEQEQEAGLDFVYFNAADESTAGARMMEQSGGGTAVLDLEGDGHPDLFFTQGAEWAHGAPRAAPDPTRIDRLYRNLAGRAFEDVTEAARLVSAGFGQGVAVGDFNNDGFADVYVANVGPNRLFLNNGDGTFSDVTADAGIAGEAWTTSCLICDLNADGMPDLYDVNYVSGAHVYEMICEGKACGPKSFDGTLDRLLISRGDGTFEEHPIEMDARGAKGLGVIAADLEGNGRPSLYIANDQEPNFLLSNTPADNQANIRLFDEGFVRGLAVNEDGLPLGSMGIAADDVDHDGRIDFFVTNFAEEYNNLYLQESPGLFIDRARASGLHASGFDYVGWGAQFLDADCDGEPDVVLANGHIDDYRSEGGLYKMPSLFFRNLGGARFVELSPDECGEYFAREFLGRSMARLDWNGDGLPDFVVSNIAEPAALVTNRTAGAGHFLNVRLRATSSARDAIGTIVDVQAGERQFSRQLVAGDGYLCSNERLLHFGLGPVQSVWHVTVRWPGGGTTTLRDVAADATLLIVEGAASVGVRRGTALGSRAVDAAE